MLVLLGTRVAASDPSLDVSQLAHTAWSARDGSFRGAINAIGQTSDGYLWLGTGFGLLRFDGVRFVEWQPRKGDSLPRLPIQKVLGSRDGSLWVGGAGGFARLKDGKIKNYPELDGVSVFTILEDRSGTIWVGGLRRPNARLCSIKDDQVHCDGDDGKFGESVSSLHEDKAGNLWVGSSTGLWHWSPGSPKLYPNQGTTAATAIITDGSGKLLMAAQREMRTLTSDGVNQTYPLRLNNSQVQPEALLKDKSNGLWIGTLAQGLVHVHSGKMDSYTPADGLSGGGFVFDLFEDREGSIWVATVEGLDRFRDIAVPTISAKQGLSNSYVTSVLGGSDGSLWVATRDGLNQMKDGELTIYRKKQGLPDNVVPSIFQDHRGRILASTYTANGLAWLRDGRFVRSTAPGENIFSIAEDVAGSFWLSDREIGLIHLRPDGTHIETISWDKMRMGPAVSVAVDTARGGLWLASSHGDLWHFKNGQIQERYGSRDGLGEGEVRDVQVDADGAVWISTEIGLSRLKDGKISTLSSKNGLPCDTVHWKREDEDHAIWLYTACGLVRLAPSELVTWTKQPNHQVKFTLYDNSDGVENLSINGYYTPYVAKASDGRLFFATPAGLALINTRSLASNKLPPPVHIEQLTADGKDYPMSGLVSLPPLVRNIRIDYTALSFVDPRKVQFRYKLEGYDNEWNGPVNVRQVTYTNLRPGEYRFRVIASNNSGIWNESGTALDLKIMPAFYQTNWFLLLCAAVVALLGWAASQWRVRQAQARAHIQMDERLSERTRIARELHDTLLQSFQGLLLHFQKARNLLPERAAEAIRTLDRALDGAEQAIVEGRDAILDLRSSTPAAKGLVEEITSLGQELVAKNGQDAAQFRVVIEGTAQTLNPNIHIEVSRIAREGLRNAFSHSQARRIETEVAYSNNLFRLRIRDDGKGVDPEVRNRAERVGHWGLAGMRERAKRLGGELKVWSEPGAGTEVDLRVPASIAYQSFPARSSVWLFWKKKKNRHDDHF